jgi:prevent-host-death family protein
VLNTYSIYEAKARLSEIVRRVKAKERIVITERGKPVAKLVPIEHATTFQARISELESAGALQLNDARRLARIGPVARRPGALNRFLSERE